MSSKPPQSVKAAREHILEIKNENYRKSPDLANAAELLRKGMFPERIRFFLELIQNAADAARQNDENCRVEIEITKDYVIIKNDARQFAKRDVKGLCSVGQSHKREKPNYVGYWGFGFKSVFRITEEPYVISPPYQFKFDREEWKEDEEDVPWEITPIWVEESELPVEPEPNKNIFVLPIKGRDGEYKQEILDDLQERIDDVLKSELPLILPNLDCIQIRNRLTGEERTLRAELEGTRVGGKIYRTEDETRWWVFRDEHTVPDTIREHPETEDWNREAVETRDIVVGIGIDEAGNPESRHLSPQAGIYSFTPLGEESVGLPFLLQGDFLAEAGRRSADKDVRWNHWLAEKAGETVVHATKQLTKVDEWRPYVYDAVIPNDKVQHKLFGGHDRIDAWPGVETSQDRNRSEWAGTDAVILQWFKSNPTILTETGTRKCPEDVYVPEDDEFRKIIEPADLREYLSGYYVDEKVRNQWQESVRKRLLGYGNVVNAKLLRKFITDDNYWLQGKAEKNNAPAWFNTLYSVLEEEIRGMSSSTQGRRRRELRDASFLLTDRGLVAPTDDTQVVIPSNNEEAEQILKKVGATVDFVQIKSGAVDDNLSRHFVKRFHVDEVDAEWVVEHAILPQLQNASPSVNRIVELTSYVKDHLENYRKAEGMIVATKGNGSVSAEQVYCGSPYDPVYDVETIFGDERHYLSEEYKKQYNWDAEWQSFFEEIGVTPVGTDKEDVLKAINQLSNKQVERLKESLTELYSLLLDKFESLPSSATIDSAVGTNALQLLGDDGEFYPAQELYVSDEPKIARVFEGNDEISFAWVPASERVGADTSDIWQLLRRLGAESAEVSHQKEIYSKAAVEPQDETPKTRLARVWDSICSEVDVDRDLPDIEWVEETGTVYQLGSQEARVPAEDNCAYDANANQLYFTPSFTSNWEALAEVLYSELGGRKRELQEILEGGAPTLEDRAIDKIRQLESAEFDEVVDVRYDNYHNKYDVRGCDVFAISEGGAERRYIEVKARRSEDTAVHLIGNEPEKAENEQENYYLYIAVLPDTGEDSRVYRLRNPASTNYETEPSWRINKSNWKDGEEIILD